LIISKFLSPIEFRLFWSMMIHEVDLFNGEIL